MAEQLKPKNQTESAVADLKDFHKYLAGLTDENIDAVAEPKPVGIIGSSQYEAVHDLEELRKTFMRLPSDVIVQLAEQAAVEIEDDAIDHSDKSPEAVKQVWLERRFNLQFILSFLSEEQKAKLL